MSKRRGGRNHYVSHIQQRPKRTGEAKKNYLRRLYPAFFERERMRAREERRHWIHEIGRATGINPVTGRKYREQEQEKKWYPKSGAARTAKGRAAQETKVGFGAPKKKRKQFEADEGAGPPPPDTPVRGDVPRVKAEEHFSQTELAMMRPPPAMSPEQQAAYMESLQKQRQTAIPTVDPTRAPPDVEQAGCGRAEEKTPETHGGLGAGVRTWDRRDPGPGRADRARG